jgi:HSP20 family protein
VDAVEGQSEVTVTIALPGVEPEKIELHLENDTLAVSAVRPPPACSRTTVIRRIEIPYGRFERRIALPSGRYELVEQTTLNGCLHLRLRKS